MAWFKPSERKASTMTPESYIAIANVLWTGVAAVGLWATCHFFAFPHFRDTLRFRLFVIRREMFLLVATGTVASNDEAYGRLRSLINSSIRYADQISAARSLVGALTHKHLGQERAVKTEAAIQALPEPVAAQMREFRTKVRHAVLMYSLATTPFGWLLLLTALLVVVPMTVSSSLQRLLVGWWTGIVETLRKRTEDQTQCRRSLEEDRFDDEAVLAAA